jgi:GR25 family glycosyltransferase involved in LPS biosynthesis
MILITYWLKESTELIAVIEENSNSGLFEHIFCYVKKLPTIQIKNVTFVEDKHFKIENCYKILLQNANKMCVIANPQHLITFIEPLIDKCGYKTCWKFGPNIILDTRFMDKQMINQLTQSRNVNVSVSVSDIYKTNKFKLFDLSNYVTFKNKVPSEQEFEFIEKSIVPAKIILTTTDFPKLSNIHINCINLKRATDRRLRIYNFFKEYSNFTLIDAMDGDSMDEHEYCCDFPKTTPKSNYEICCNFSHLSAIKNAYERGLDMCLIMEDDVDLNVITRWDFELNTILSTAPKDWEILQLYTNNPNLMLRLHEYLNKTKTLWSPWCPSAWSTGFYVINRLGMEKLLNKYLVLNKFDLTKFDKNPNFLVADFIIYDECVTYLINKPIIHEDALNSYIHTTHVNAYQVKCKKIVTQLYEGKSINLSRHDEYIDENIIFLNGFKKGFEDKTDGVHVGLLEQLFKGTKLDHFKLTSNPNEANILVESVFTSQSFVNAKLWKYKIQLSGESRIFPNSNYSMVLSSNHQTQNIITFPFGFQFIHTQNLVSNMSNRNVVMKVPKHFCCWIVSNGQCEIRNKMFIKLSEYKKVHSYGKYLNNMNLVLKFPYWSENYQKIMSNYKFSICFENKKFEKYVTEKIINPFIARSIPIYWGTDYVNEIFNKQAFLYLEDESDQAIEILIAKIKELDSNDEMYLKMLNEPAIYNMNKFNMYSPENISKKINNLI